MAKYTWCNGISLAYGLPAILSMLFSTVFMMVDFIIACVTNKKVNNNIYIIAIIMNYVHIYVILLNVITHNQETPI